MIERTSTTPIWEQTIQELQELLKYQGAFRDVRSWELKAGGEWETGENGNNNRVGIKLQLFSQNSNGGYDSTPHSPNLLIDPKGRRLILLVSDSIYPVWRNKLIYPVLESWGKHGMLALLHLLPEKLWSRTALAQETPVLLSSLQPGAFNSQLISQIWDEDDNIEDKIQNPKSQIQNILVPIITLEPEPLLIWSQVIATQGNIYTAGFKFSTHQNNTLQSTTNTQQLTSSELVSRFRATASLQARRLAGLLASAPVSISIVHLIQQTLLPESTQIHVAEVFMSGMLRSLPSSVQNDVDYTANG